MSLTEGPLYTRPNLGTSGGMSDCPVSHPSSLYLQFVHEPWSDRSKFRTEFIIERKPTSVQRIVDARQKNKHFTPTIVVVTGVSRHHI